MRKTTLLLALLFAVTTAFIGGDKREAIKYDDISLNKLLTNNLDSLVSTPSSTDESAQYTWVQTGSIDDTLIVLKSNPDIIDTTICETLSYQFLPDKKLNIIRNSNCADAIPVMGYKSYTYLILYKNSTAYFAFSPSSLKVFYHYIVKSVERVYYTPEQNGYEITLVKQ